MNTPLEGYNNSLVGGALLEGLDSVGILNVINQHQYILDVIDNGEQGEEEPTKHKIVIKKQLLLGEKAECAFVTEDNTIEKESDAYKESIEALESYKLKIPLFMGAGVEEVSHIILMDSKRCYYEHIITVYVQKRDSENMEEYVERLFIFIADLIVGSKI